MSDEEVTGNLGPDNDPGCLQITYKTDIRIVKERILERRKKETIQGMIKIFLLNKFIIHNVV